MYIFLEHGIILLLVECNVCRPEGKKMSMIRMSLSLRCLVIVTAIMAPSITAMDNANTLELLKVSDSAKFCHLRRLPDPIKRYIAFSAFEQESEKEFIERTRIQEEVSYAYCKNFFTPNVGGEEPLHSAVYCPYKINIALIESLRGNVGQPTITIIDAVNNKLVHSENLDRFNVYAAIAVSRDAAMFATLSKTTSDKNNVVVLKVKNIGTQKIQEFNIHDPALFRWRKQLNFNKQGTQIILHTLVEATLMKSKITESNPAPSSFLKINCTSPYRIFDLKMEALGTMTSVESLEEHFEHQMVCKDFMESKPYLTTHKTSSYAEASSHTKVSADKTADDKFLGEFRAKL
jgi:hypothetical protein